jgi:hypothetical protein
MLVMTIMAPWHSKWWALTITSSMIAKHSIRTRRTFTCNP